MKTFRIPEPEWAQAMFNRLKTMISNLKLSIDGAGFITQETDPTVPAWAKAANKPTYSASEVGALSSSDVANNLTTTAAGKVLDARQGKALKDLIDGITVPTKTSELTNDGDGTSSYARLSDLPVVPTKTSDLTNDGNGTSRFAMMTDIQSAVASQFNLISLDTDRGYVLSISEVHTELKKVPVGEVRVFTAYQWGYELTHGLGNKLHGIIYPHGQNYTDTIDRYYYFGFDSLDGKLYTGSFNIGRHPVSGEDYFTVLEVNRFDPAYTYD